MVEKLMKIFHKEYGGLHQAALLLAAFALFSQALALVRDRLLAHFFGASAPLDIYYAAFRIPDFLFVSIASFVSITVLIPLIIEKGKDGTEHARKFISDVFTVYFLAMATIAAVAFVAIPSILPLLFAGFSAGEQETLIEITRILLLSPLLLGISNLFGSITQTYRRFFVYALSPVLYNAGIILGILFLYPSFGIVGLGWGVVLGTLLHLFIQLPVVIRQRLVPRLSFRVDPVHIKRVVVLSLPRTIGLSSQQIALLVLVGLASLMAEGSITVFNFSYNLQSVPLSIIGVSYSMAAFPTLARLFSDNRMTEFIHKMMTAARHILFWSLPFLVLFIVLRAQIVRTVLGSGEFSWADTRLTAAALALFAVSLVAQAFVLLFVRGYYAAGETTKPVVVNVVASLGIIAFAYALGWTYDQSLFFRLFIEDLLRVSDIQGTKVLMLPLAFSVGMLANAGALLFLFVRDFESNIIQLTRAFWHSFSAAVVGGFVAYQFLGLFGRFFDLDTFAGIFFQGLFAGIIGVIASIALLQLVRSRELNEVARALHTRFWRTKVIAPEQEEL